MYRACKTSTSEQHGYEQIYELLQRWSYTRCTACPCCLSTSCASKALISWFSCCCIWWISSIRCRWTRSFWWNSCRMLLMLSFSNFMLVFNASRLMPGLPDPDAPIRACRMQQMKHYIRPHQQSEFFEFESLDRSESHRKWQVLLIKSEFQRKTQLWKMCLVSYLTRP